MTDDSGGFILIALALPALEPELREFEGEGEREADPHKEGRHINAEVVEGSLKAVHRVR